MAITCEHAHFGLLWQRRSVPKPHLSVFPVFLFRTCMSEIKFLPCIISRLTGKCATQNLKNLRNSSLWTC